MSETKVPGSVAHHSWITDECRTNRGDDGAVDEILIRARKSILGVIDGWKVGQGVKIHLTVTVERPAS